MRLRMVDITLIHSLLAESPSSSSCSSKARGFGSVSSNQSSHLGRFEVKPAKVVFIASGDEQSENGDHDKGSGGGTEEEDTNNTSSSTGDDSQSNAESFLQSMSRKRKERSDQQTSGNIHFCPNNVRQQLTSI